VSRRLKAILLPGLDGMGRLFAPLLAAGPRAFEAVPLSYPPDEPLGYDELAALVRPKLPRGRFVLLAESFSGPLALRLAAEAPRGLEAVILAATFLRRPLDPLLHPFRALVGTRLLGMRRPAWAVRQFMAGPDAPASLVKEMQDVGQEVKPLVLAHRAAEALAVDAREALSAVEVPVLFLAPTRDRLIRRDAWTDVATMRPDAEVVHVEAPHMILQRCPHACLARIEEFLGTIARGAKETG
jgi:pimeloyl-ACP methyl ester carboxylesterase